MAKTKRVDIAKTIERKSKHLLVKLMLFIWRPLKKNDNFEGPLDSIIIIAQEKLGDAILLTPLIKNLRRALPHINIHIVALSNIYRFFRLDSNVDVVHRVKHNYFNYFRTISKLKFDLLFSTKDHASFNFLFHARFIKARHRVGIDHFLHGGFFNHLITLDFHQHIIEKNCSLLNFIGIPYQKQDCRPYMPEDTISDEVNIFLKDFKDTQFIIMNLSAGEKDREWSLHKWIGLIKLIHQPIIILAMPDRKSDKQKLETMFEHVKPSPLTKSIYEAGQIIKQAKLLISSDTALIHVASCYNTAVVGLYRAHEIHVDRFYPFLIPNKCVISTSYKIEDIPIKSVVEAAEEMLGLEN